MTLLTVRLARLSAVYTIYGKPDCPHCVRATALLEYNSIDYHYINISSNESARQYIKETLGFKTVPVTVDSDGAVIGGYDDLAAEFGSDLF